MKTINIKCLIFFLFSVVLVVSCKKGDDLYVSPNNPLNITPALQLTAIEVSTFNSYEGALTKYSSILIQQNVGVEGQAGPINNYILAENEFDNQWGQLYQALYNCKDLQKNFGEENPYYSGIADVLAALNWGMLTDLWGDIPFSEALQAQINNKPKFDAQKDVIIGIISMLDQGIAKLSQPSDANALLPGDDDLAYKGDIQKWIKLAYSVKARYQNRLSKTSLYNASDVLESLSKGISNTSEDFVSIHGSKSNELNQWFDFQNNREYYIVAGAPFVDAIKERPTDERLNAYFTKNDDNEIVGSSVSAPTPDNVSLWGAYLAGGPDVGVHLVSFVEMKFIEAEVKARQGVDASVALNEAIKESCLTVTGGVYDGDDIADYTASNASVEKVIFEKWIALFGSMEPYNDYRKTGFPALTVNPNGRLSVIPKRFPTPQAERVTNPNSLTPALTEAVWWAQ